MSILHVTNGDVAAELLRELDPGSEVLPWRDVLHEGPVPAGLALEELSEVRALFIGSIGWEDYHTARESFATRDRVIRDHGRFDEIALWFEWDLYDQLQLIQIIDFLVSEQRPLSDITVVNCAGYLGELSVEQLNDVADDFSLLTQPAAIDAVDAWNAFRSSDPAVLFQLIRNRAIGGESLPFLRAALYRLLEELPSVQNGLSRCEQSILEALRRGPLRMDALFVAAHQAREERRFLGDTVFKTQLDRLRSGARPLVGDSLSGMLDEVAITDVGVAVCSDEGDWLTLGAPERWIGGVSVGPNSPRWDRNAGVLIVA